MAERRVKLGTSFFVAAISASLGAAACTASTGAAPDGGGGDDSGNSTGDDGASTCQSGNYPVDPWAPPVTKVGKPASGDPGDAGASGTLTFALESNEVGDASSPPNEPNINAFTLKVMDSSGQPVKDATVLLPANNQALGWMYSKDPWMPLHGHGASVGPTITNNNDGTYTLSVDLFMAGLWWIYVVAETPSGVTDSALFSFCLQ
jgi:hypothetical protein